MLFNIWQFFIIGNYFIFYGPVNEPITLQKMNFSDKRVVLNQDVDYTNVMHLFSKSPVAVKTHFVYWSCLLAESLCCLRRFTWLIITPTDSDIRFSCWTAPYRSEEMVACEDAFITISICPKSAERSSVVSASMHNDCILLAFWISLSSSVFRLVSVWSRYRLWRSHLSLTVVASMVKARDKATNFCSSSSSLKRSLRKSFQVSSHRFLEISRVFVCLRFSESFKNMKVALSLKCGF